MVFTLLLAADLHGTKVNYEVPFPGPPTLAELQHRAHSLFGPEFVQRRPAVVPPHVVFAIDMMQVFDEAAEVWVDLLSPSQLHDAAQVYVFQPETEWHREVQSKLPPAAPVSFQPVPALHSPRSPRPDAVAVLPPPSHVGHPLPPPPPPPGADLLRAPTPALTSTGSVVPMPVPVPAPVPIPASVVPLPAPHAAAINRGSDVSHHEKVTVVFDHLSGGTGALNMDDWQTAFARLRVDLDRAATADLFRRTDVNCDGIVTAPEFQRFAELYPTMLDALHYRAREWWIDQRQKDGINAARRLCDSLRGRVLESRQGVEQSAADARQQEVACAAQERSVQVAEQRVLAAAAATDAASQDTERARRDCGSLVQGLAAAREAERQKEQAALVAQSETAAAGLRVRVVSAEAERAEEKLREIEMLLAEQRLAVDAHLQHVARANAELVAAQRSEQAAEVLVAEAKRGSQVAAEALGLGEAELGRAQERERAAGAEHLHARDELARHAALKDQEEQTLAAVRVREGQRRLIEEEALRAVDAQEKMAAALEAENLEHNMQRLRAEDEEKPLVTQEVLLRAERASLEEREAELRHASGDFSERMKGRALVPTSALVAPGPQPSALLPVQVSPTARAIPAAVSYAGPPPAVLPPPL